MKILFRFFAAAAFLFCAQGANAQVCNDPSGFLKSFGPYNIGDFASFGPDCQHLQGGIIGSISSNSIIYTWPLGGVAESQTSYNRQRVSVIDCGAVGDGVTDDAPAFRKCYDGVNDGGEIFIPPPPGGIFYRMNSCRNNAVLESITSNSNKAVSIVGSGWNIKTQGSYSNPRGSVVQMGPAIPDTCSFIRMAGTDIVTGVRYKDFAVIASTGTFGTPVGLHGIFIDESLGGGNFYMTNLIVDHVFIDNMKIGYSIKVAAVNTGTLSGGMAYGKIRNSQLISFNADFVGDNDTIENNVFGQNATNDARNVGIEFSMVDGGTTFEIFNNVFSNFNGMIIIHKATAPIIRDNELEQGSTNTHGSMIDLVGDLGPVTQPVIEGNSISQNNLAASTIPIRVAAVNNAQISKNRIALAATSNYAHITITGGSSAAWIGPNFCTFNTSVSETIDLGCTIADSGIFTFKQAQFSQNLPGSTSGFTIVQNPAVATGTINIPAPISPITDTYALVGNAQTLANKALQGVTNGTNAAAGIVGEPITSTVGSPGGAVTSATPADCTFIDLTPGDWIVSSMLYTNPAATTNLTAYSSSQSLVLNTFDSTPGRFNQVTLPAHVPGGLPDTSAIAGYHWNVSVTTRIHLVGFAVFTVSTMNIYCYIQAIRIR